MLPNFSGTPAVEIDNSADPYTQTRLAAQQGNNMQQMAEGKKLENEKMAQDNQIKEQRLQAAQIIFGTKGINEDTINEYGMSTGDITGAQEYLGKWRTDQKLQQDIVGLRDTHSKAIQDLVKSRQDIVKAQQDYDNKSFEQFANIAAGMDLNNPESVAAHRALLEAAADEVKSIEINPETGEIQYGPPMQVPEVITPEWKQSIISRATSLAQRETERNNRASERVLSLKEQRAVEEKERKRNLPGIDPNTDKPYTEGQKTKAERAVAMYSGNRIIEELNVEGFDEANFVNQMVNTFKKKEQLSRVDFLNAARTEQQRQYLQAQLDFMIPHLRDQSGAAINADEYVKEVSQFFPVTGDGPKTIAQKERARRREVLTRRRSSGKLFDLMISDIEEDEDTRSYTPSPETEDIKNQYELDY